MGKEFNHVGIVLRWKFNIVKNYSATDKKY